MEIMVACSAMAAVKEVQSQESEPKSKWSKWKRGGIIGAAALAGGTLLAISGGIVLISGKLSYVLCMQAHYLDDRCLC